MMIRSNDGRCPSDLTDAEMATIADYLEDYLDMFENVFIIPENLKGSKKVIERSISKTHELIDRLRKGDRKVFKDDEDCDLL